LEETGTGILFAAHPTYQLRETGGHRKKRGQPRSRRKKSLKSLQPGVNNSPVPFLKEKKPVLPVKEESFEKSTCRKKRKYYFKKRSRDNGIDKYIDNTSCYLLDLKTLKWSKE
jgi:hypothetical protein